MTRSTKESWLDGPGDLKTAEVEDVPVPGETVLVRGLPAAYSNRASSEALEMTSQGREQVARVNTARLEVIQFCEGVLEPKFSEAETQIISEKYGPAFKRVVAKIDELSGVDKEAIKKAEARFPRSGAEANGDHVEPGTPARGR